MLEVFCNCEVTNSTLIAGTGAMFVRFVACGGKTYDEEACAAMSGRSNLVVSNFGCNRRAAGTARIGEGT